MNLKMKVGLSGPELCLAPGDTHDFDDAVEAQRLIDADYAELAVVVAPTQVTVPAVAAKPKTSKPAKAAN